MNENKANDFCERIKFLRKVRDKKQSQMADEIGVSRQSMSNYESGKNVPDLDTIAKIARYLDCSTDYLLGLTNFYTQQDHVRYAKQMEKFGEYLTSPYLHQADLWFTTFLQLAECVHKDTARKMEFGFRVQVILSMVANLIEHCIETRDKQESGALTEVELKSANHKRQQIIHQLSRIEIGDLDNISYFYINNLLESDE